MNIDPKTWSAARRALEKALVLYLDDPNVALIDLGLRTRSADQHRLEPELAVRIHLRRKLLDAAFQAWAVAESHRVIEAQRLGFAVDVPEAIYRLDWWQATSTRAEELCDSRPFLAGGLALSNPHDHRRGTLGGKVRDRQSGAEMLLSSWHVLSGAEPGEQEMQLGSLIARAADGEAETIAEYQRSAIHCGLDAAVAQLRSLKPLRHEQIGIGPVTGVTIPQLGMRVIKSGAGTGVTRGVITGVLGYAMHLYGSTNHVVGPLVHIAPEAPEQPLSGAGDSGAWWLESSTRRAVALHFASSTAPRFALAFSMPEVLKALEVDIVSAPEEEAAWPLSSPAVAVTMPAATEEEALARKALDYPAVADLDEEAYDSAAPPFVAELETPKRRRLRVAAIEVAAFTLAVVWGPAAIELHKHLQRSQQHQRVQLDGLQDHAQKLQAIQQSDSLRQLDLERARRMIDRLAPKLESALRLSLADEIERMTRKYPQLNIELICATITFEASWNPNAVSWAGAMGLMQIMPATGIYLAEAEGIPWTSAEEVLFNPNYNLRLGCRYLAMLIDMYGMEAGLAGYNAGERWAGRWQLHGGGAEGMPAETAAYVPGIMHIYKKYQNTRH